jgi:PAS domain S-box-containing protein
MPDRVPFTVTPQTLVSEAIAQVSSPELSYSCAVLVIDALRPVGILTEQDILRLCLARVELSQLPISQVMTHPLITLKLDPTTTLQGALRLLDRHQIHHLPIVDDQGELVGLVTRERLYQELAEHQREAFAQWKQRESVLQSSQQQWQTIFDQTFQFIGLLQPDGVLIDANRAALEFVEATLEQVVGRPFWQTPWWSHDPEQHPSLQAAIAEAAAGQFVRREFTHCSTRGTIKTFDFSITPILSDAGQVMSLVAEGRNIEDRKQLERQLQAAQEDLEQQVADRTQELSQSEEEFRVLATHTPVGIFQTDAVGDCVFVNQRWLELTGLSLAQAMGQGWANALHPEDRERVCSEWDEAAQSGQEFYSEYRFQTPEGQVVWVIGSATGLQDETGSITGYLGTVTDITDRKSLEIERQQWLRQVETARNQVITILESITDGFIALDHDWRFTYVNAQAGRILQRNPTDLLGKVVWSEFTDVTETAFYREYHRAVSERVTVKFEEFYAPLTTWFAVHAYPSVDGLVTYFQDITPRKQAEAALRNYATEVEDLYNHAPCGYHSLDQHGVFVQINDTELDWLGYTRDEVVGRMTAADVLTLESLQTFAETFPAFIQRGWVRDLEFQMCRKDGTTFPVLVSANAVRNESGNYLMSRSTVYDISDRKQANQKIQEQAALLDITSDAIFVRDLNQHILYWNQGAERLYGWSVAEATGQKADELLYENPTQISEMMKTLLERGQWQGELRKITKTNREVMVESRWTLMRDERGQPKSILTVNTDITEKKQLEAQFLHAQRLECLGMLASGIAHDLGNILMPVLGVARLLPSRIGNMDESMRALVDILENNAIRGRDLVQQILMFARGTGGERIPLQVEPMLKELMKTVCGTFPKSIHISTHIPSNGLWLVEADATQLHQVFMNLCVNARDAMSDGGTLTIAVENCVLDPTFVAIHPDAQVGSYLKVSISDTGTGIVPEMRDRIFDPFFTSKEPGKGTGLGLSTVMKIIKTHQGFIHMTTQVGQGTCFMIYLPVLSEGAVSQAD